MPILIQRVYSKINGKYNLYSIKYYINDSEWGISIMPILISRVYSKINGKYYLYSIKYYISASSIISIK